MKVSKIIGSIIVVLIMALAGYIAFLTELPIPGRLIVGVDFLERPWTYFISGSIASLGLTIAFLVADDSKYRNVATGLFVMSFILFWIGTMAGTD